MKRANEKTLIDAYERKLAAEDLGTTYLVEAAAGTGKTTILVGRIINILANGTPPERLVAITFTENAAAELADRVREALEEKIEKAASEAEGSVFAAALAGLGRAHISTIHSFAAQILRRYPVEAGEGGIDPRFVQLDALGQELLLADVLEEWTDDVFTRADPPPALIDALSVGLQLKDIEAAVVKAVQYRDLSGPPVPQEPGGPAADHAYHKKRLDGILSDAEAECKDKNDKLYQFLRTYRKLFETGEGTTGPDFVFWAEVTKFPPFRNAGAAKNWADRDRIRARVKELVEDVKATAASYKRNLLSRLVNVVREDFLKRYEDEKSARGALDFFDLLLKARDLLVKRKDVRKRLQESFDYILVDEFQDTDPLQAETVFLLAEDGARAADWREVRLKPGKLFLVGDPKQSIFRFRRADIETYLTARRLIADSAGGRVLEIRQNFRNVPGICEWVNAAFEKNFAGQARQAAYIPITPYRGEFPEGAGSVILLRPTDEYVLERGRDYLGKTDKITKDAYRRAEAYAIVSTVEKAVREGWPVEEKPADGETVSRPITYSDFAILFAVLGNAWDIYKKTFDEFGVPYRISGGREYFARPEVRELGAVLRAVANPADGTSVVAALRSPFFGVSDADIYRQALAGGFDYTVRSGREPAAVATAFDLLGELRKKTNGKVSDTVELLYEKTSHLPLRTITREGYAAANLAKAIELARAYEDETTGTLYGFAAWLTGRAETADEPDAETATGDFVQVMTVHKAKGLEFNAVVVANLVQGLNLKVEAICDRERNVLEIGLKKGLETAGYVEKLEDEKAALRAEISRVNYVAATRARDYLIIPLFGNTGVENYLADFNRDDDLTLTLDPAEIPLPHPWSPPEAKPSLDLGAEVEALTERLREALGRPKGNEKYIAPSEQVEFTAERPDEGTSRPTDYADKGKAVGRALHAVMETVNLSDPGDIDDLAERNAAEEGVLESTKEITEMARFCLASKVVKEAIKTGKYYRELRFEWLCEDRGPLVEGAVDLAVETEDGFVIADYKTDRVEADAREHAKEYLPQIGTYAIALEKITGKTVREGIIVLPWASMEVTFGRGELVEAGERVLHKKT